MKILLSSALVLSLAAGLAACDNAPAPESDPGAELAEQASDRVAPAAPGSEGSYGDETVAPAPAFTGDLPGRVFAIAADDAIDDPTNVAWSFDPLRGEGQRLWRTEEPEVLEWRAAPVGAVAAYRESWHGEPKTEALVARPLVEGVEADYLLLLDPEISRLAGHVWPPTGDALAYGRQLGSPASFAGGEALDGWELHALSVGGARMSNDSNDRTLWRAPEEELVGWSPRLLAWRPEAGLALIAATAIDGAFVQELWSLEIATGKLTRHVPEAPAVEVVPAPEADRVAWLNVDGRLEVRDVADGALLAAWDALPPDMEGFATRPLWSADGRWLAWTTFLLTPEGERATVRVADAAAPELPARDVGLASAGVQALAFGPDGRLLLGSGPLGAPEMPAVLVVDPSDAVAYDLGWSLPLGTWEVAWLAADEPATTP